MSAESVDRVNGVVELPLEWQAQVSPPLAQDGLKNGIQLWTLDLAELDLQTMTAMASDAETARASRIRNPQKRALYLGGRIGLRKLLCQCSGLTDQALQFGYGGRGKPRLENRLDGGELTFNYTLSGDKVLYAISMNRQLGVDLELVPRQINASLMARSKLTEQEQQVWKALPSSSRDAAMLCCWTRKEAYGKVIGVGIRYFLNQVELFTELDQPWFHTERIGLFETTRQSAMPQWLQGVQIALPFSGVASLMYEQIHVDEPRLPITAARLEL